MDEAEHNIVDATITYAEIEKAYVVLNTQINLVKISKDTISDLKTDSKQYETDTQKFIDETDSSLGEIEKMLEGHGPDYQKHIEEANDRYTQAISYVHQTLTILDTSIDKFNQLAPEFLKEGLQPKLDEIVQYRDHAHQIVNP